MNEGHFHKIWQQQYEAAETIKLRYGLRAAFDYLVGEKLLNFAEAAEQHPEFAQELPRFVSAVRELFTRQEIQEHVARLERERLHDEAAESDEVDDFGDDPEILAKRASQFASIRELLTATALGTS